MACSQGHAQSANNKQFVPPKMLYYLDTTVKERVAVFYFDPRESEEMEADNSYVPAGVSKSEIGIIQQLISNRVAVYNRVHSKPYERIIKPEKYFKKLVAATNDAGEKKVVAFCYCTVLKDFLKKGNGVTSDGGRCYFVVRINLTKRKVEKFSTGGLG